MNVLKVEEEIKDVPVRGNNMGKAMIQNRK
jgi:hypothetical protein